MLSQHAQKLADVRQRLGTVNSTLIEVQARLGRVQNMADRLQQEQEAWIFSAGLGGELGDAREEPPEEDAGD